MRRWLFLWQLPIICFVVVFATLGVEHIVNSNPGSVTANPHPAKHVWMKADSLAYAHDQMEVFTQNQFSCLSNLWGKESGWDAKAHNPVRVQGKTAGGIPQLLGMSPLVPPTLQIDRGLSYIYYRYSTPCNAWKHWKQRGWY